MSYQVMARRHRPTQFDSVVGQERAVKTLQHALDSGRLPHAILFSGSRGVGKTSLARIIARCLACTDSKSVSQPCDQCSSCQAIDSGSYLDLIEVDAASRTQVDETRSLLETTQLVPSQGKYRIYLIDEVHMLSTHSFNALLKTLEEPPDHVFFLLATTEPQKLPDTIISRCLWFNLQTVAPNDIGEHIENLLNLEGASYDPESVAAISAEARGSIRDALTLTEHALAHGNNKLAIDEVARVLGTVSSDQVLQLCTSIIEDDCAQSLVILRQLFANNASASAILNAVLKVWHGLALDLTMNTTESGMHQRLNKPVATTTIQLLYQITLAAIRDLAITPSDSIAAEMAIMRLHAYIPSNLLKDGTDSAYTDTVTDAVTVTANDDRKTASAKTQTKSQSKAKVKPKTAETASVKKKPETADPTNADDNGNDNGNDADSSNESQLAEAEVPDLLKGIAQEGARIEQSSPE